MNRLLGWVDLLRHKVRLRSGDMRHALGLRGEDLAHRYLRCNGLTVAYGISP